MGPNYGPPFFFIHSVFLLSSFVSCSKDASQPRGGTSTARTRSANPEEDLEGRLSGFSGTEKEREDRGEGWRERGVREPPVVVVVAARSLSLTGTERHLCRTVDHDFSVKRFSG